jgi:hypothetical protein
LAKSMLHSGNGGRQLSRRTPKEHARAELP